MPNSNSAKKRMRQNVTRRNQNHSIKSAVRTQIRKVRKAVATGEVEVSEVEFRAAAKKLDRAAAKNIIHANTAARTKSRLSKTIKNLKNAGETASS